MELLKKKRYDYFLIWGNGIPYKRKIVDIIRGKDFLKILRIMNHRPKSVQHLVRVIYSYDYAPLQHLKSKTKYLLKTDQGVVFIFVLNQDTREIYSGKGPFRHIECEQIKQVKNEIRDKFNPRVNGKRTEEHVIHASDNQSQVDHVLKYLGFKPGLRFLKNNPNPMLSLPHYLPRIDKFVVRRVKTNELYGTILSGTSDSYSSEMVAITHTPQYACITGNRSTYQNYLEKFLGGPLTGDYSLENILCMAKNLNYLAPPHTTSYIVVREVQPNQYLILDGLHRACILDYLGASEFPVAVVQ
jgi:hypothetical protein